MFQRKYWRKQFSKRWYGSVRPTHYNTRESRRLRLTDQPLSYYLFADIRTKVALLFAPNYEDQFCMRIIRRDETLNIELEREIQ